MVPSAEGGGCRALSVQTNTVAKSLLTCSFILFITGGETCKEANNMTLNSDGLTKGTILTLSKFIFGKVLQLVVVRMYPQTYRRFSGSET